ncbi:hypothetical protein COOONC_13868 [Cooperia oncophora]
MFAGVCYKFGDIADSKRSSRKAVDSAIFVALTTGLGMCDEERAKDFYTELRQRRRYICMQHFQDTAQSLYDEVIATRGSFPEIPSELTPKTNKGTCARTRPYDTAVSSGVLQSIRRVAERLDKSVRINQMDLISYVAKAKEKGYIRDTALDSKCFEPVRKLKWRDPDEMPPVLEMVSPL